MALETTLLNIVNLEVDRHKFFKISSYLIAHSEISQEDRKLLKEMETKESISRDKYKDEYEIKFLYAAGYSSFVEGVELENPEIKMKYSVWEDRWNKYLLCDDRKFNNGRIARIINVGLVW